MPIYSYRCPQGHITEAWAKMDDYKKPITCRCGEQAERKITAPTIKADIGSDKWADMHEKEGRRESNPNLTHY